MTMSGQVNNQQTAGSGWLAALRTYLGASFAGHVVWETLQLPLYTIWSTGSFREQVFAVAHCTVGDLLIAMSALTIALLLFGAGRWPQASFWKVAAATLVFGLGYTVFSEWLNVAVRKSWAYAEAMPVIPLFGLQIGAAPLLQCIVIPAAAFKIMRGRTQGEDESPVIIRSTIEPMRTISRR